jgi:Divergent InlB B-repeat domain/WD40-like Beta Propeller Repeat
MHVRSIIFVAIVSTVGGGVAAPPSSAQTPGPTGLIAFSFSESCCDYDIWVMNPDGTGQVNLTNTPNASEFDPSWSPDGSKIAYVRDEGASTTDVWVMNSDGSEQTNITTSPEREFGPDWSADGAMFVFVREVPGVVISTQFDLFTMNADGTNQVNITNSDFDELDPAWSPGGTRIAFAGVRIQVPEEGGDWEIVTANTDGSAESILTVTSQEDRAPDWSPDGSMLVWMSAFDDPCCGSWDIWAMNADGSAKTNLMGEGDVFGDIYPAWSLDGTEIVFLSNRESDFLLEVFAMTAPTSLPLADLSAEHTPSAAEADPPGLHQLTDTGDAQDVAWGPGEGGGGSFSLSVAKQGTGTGLVRSTDKKVNCGADCSETYAASTAVTLLAKPSLGSVFGGWTGCTPVPGTPTKCTVTVNQATTVTATFNLSGGGGSHLLTVNKTGTGQGNVRSQPDGITCGADCTETYAAGTVVTLTARARDGSVFAGWSGACTGTASTCQVTMTVAKTVTARFNLA